MSAQHHCIGFRFRGWDGGIYRCIRYDKRRDFIMRLLDKPPQADGYICRRGEIGHEHDASPQAIGGSYHRVDWDEEPAPHEEPCDCHLCKPRAP